MRRTGFTLIELVMVIVIIGILAAVAIPRFMDLREEAEIARCQADVGALRTGISGWYAKYHANGSVCPSIAYGGVQADCTSGGFPNATELDDATGEFAQFAFSDGNLPSVLHITNDTTGCATWGAAGCYDAANGTINQIATCGGS